MSSKEYTAPNSNIAVSARIVDAIAKSSANYNVLYSPLSLNMVLAPLSAFAKGETKRELEKFLGYHDYVNYVDEIADPRYDSWREYMRKCEAGEVDKWGRAFYPDGYEVHENRYDIATSITADEKYPMKNEVMERLTQEFACANGTLPLESDPGTAARLINEFCEENTHGLIKNIVDADSVKNSQTVLVNTLYFSQLWHDEWYTMHTHDYFGKPLFVPTFTNLDGTKSRIGFMTSSKCSAYYENVDAVGFEKKYFGDCSFIGILPKNKKATDDFALTELDIIDLLSTRRIANGIDLELTARMPERLEYECTAAELVDILGEMGLSRVFTDGSEIDMLECNIPLKVDNIIQKTKIELDKEKTCAAAATAGFACFAAGMPPEPKEVKEVTLDRPFVYMITDDITGEVLFIGKVVSL